MMGNKRNKWAGKKHTEETLKKMSDSAFTRYNNPDERARMYKVSLANSHPKNCKSGNYNSSKAGNVWYRSSYELMLFELLDTFDNVLTYEVELEYVSYLYNDRIHVYIPDIKVIYRNGDWNIIEIKPQYLVTAPKNEAKFRAARDKYGDKFIIITEKDLALLCDQPKVELVGKSGWLVLQDIK